MTVESTLEENAHLVLWTTQQLAEIFGPQAPCATGISIDSRTLVPGDLFFAIKGPNFDGHAYVEQALAKGACGAVVAGQASPSDTLLPVQDPFETLKILAQKSRARFQGKVLALTGSVGKTTVKEGLMKVLSAQGATFGTYGSFNNAIGLPLSMARMPAEASFAIFELGMNRAGEIGTLARTLQPHVGLITNVSAQHIGNFDSVEAIAQAKAELLSELPSNGIGILWRDDPLFEILKNAVPGSSFTFGHHAEADVRVVSQRLRGKGGVEVEACVRGERLVYGLPSVGEHRVMNSAAILAGVSVLWADVARAARELETFLPPAGRGQQLDIGGICVVDESYNAAPQAVRAALKAYAFLRPKGKKYVLLGEMRELGDWAEQEHASLIPLIEALKADGLWFCGEQTKSLSNIFQGSLWSTHVEPLLDSIVATLKPGDSLLIKGSRSMKTFLAVDALYRSHGMEQEALAYPLRAYFHV